MTLLWLQPTPPEDGPLHARSSAPHATGPNVLIIVGDDHAANLLGIDGDSRQATPCLDRLARQGVRFQRAFCNSPLCTPSRQSFITGRYPHAVGVTQLMTALPHDAVTLGDRLSDLGYATGAVGKMHFNSNEHHGFRERIDREEYLFAVKHGRWPGGGWPRPFRPFVDPVNVWMNAANRDSGQSEAASEATYFTDHAAAFLQRHRSDPFLLVVGYHQPHAPFEYPRDFARRFRPEQFTIPPISERDRHDQPLIFRALTDSDYRNIQAAYFTSLAFLDQQVGRLLDTLDQNGLAENTIVVYLGDNGYLLGRHGRFEKNVMDEDAVRVPLLVRWPGHLPAGQVVTGMVELVDLMPTLLDLCGQPRPAALHGVSLVPLMKGKPGARGREFVFSEYQPNGEAMIRGERYKLVVGNGRPRLDPFRTENDPTAPYERLFDIQADPDEEVDLSDRVDLAPVRDRLRHELFRVMQSTPGVRGPIPAGLTETKAIHWCLIPRDRK